MFKYLTGVVTRPLEDELGEKSEPTVGTLKKLRVAWQGGYTGFQAPAVVDRETSNTSVTLFASRAEEPILEKGDRVRVAHRDKRWIFRITSDQMWTLQSQSGRYAVQADLVI
jgi:hypothetical protein